MNNKPWASSGRIPSIDGWRAFSILLVLGYHSSLIQGFPAKWTFLFKWLFDGNLGVRCFFLISGFLITWLLLREFELNRSINLQHFYIRRALRILPVYWMFLLIVAGISFFTPFKQTPNIWLANIIFITNFYPTTWTTGHLWSLAIEEQFYLIWPVVLLFLLRAKAGKVVYFLILLAVFSISALSRALGYMMHHDASRNALLSSFSFFNYWDTIAVGCALAYIISKPPAWINAGMKNPIGWIVTGLTLILTPYALERYFLLGIVTVPFGPQSEAIGLAMLVLQSIASPHVAIYRILNVSVVKSIGVLSYSAYIWQQIFCTSPRDFGLENVWWSRFPTWLIAVSLVAGVSYYGLELPFMNLRRRFRDVADTGKRSTALP